jgi:AcrR family transcriptional regulator
MKERGDTRREIIERAERLLQSKGFHGFSYREIAEPLGIKNAAIHYYFPSKTDLGVALIERYRHLIQKISGKFMEEGGDPRAQIEGYFTFNRVAREEEDKICPIGIVGADYHTVPERVREQVVLLFEETVGWLTRVLEVGLETGAFQFEGPARRKAIAMQSCLQGAGQLARIAGPEVMEDCFEQIRVDLGMR